MELKPEDLVLTTWSAGKRGGWRTEPDTGISILHKPTGAHVMVDKERSQHANKAIAMRMLEQKVSSILEQQAAKTEQHQGKVLPTCILGVGTGDSGLFVYGTYESIKAAQELVLKGEQVSSLRKALQDMVNCYVSLMNADPLNSWGNPEADTWVINARAALDKTK
jgi:protein subunit release factor B